MTVALLPETDLSCRPGNEYLVSSPEDGTEAVLTAVGRSQTAFELIFSDAAGAAAYKELLKTVQENAPSDFQYSWNERMLTLTVLNLRY